MGLSQCKKPNLPVLNAGETQHVVLNASWDNGGSKIDQDGTKFKWTEGDKLYVNKGNESIGTLKCTDVANGTFEGYIIETTGKIKFTFKGANYKDDFMGQTGFLNDAVYLESGELDYKADGNYGTVSMRMPHAVLLLDLSALGTPAGTPVTIKVVGGDPVASVKNVKNDEASKALYVAVPASPAGKQYEFVSIIGTARCDDVWALKDNTFYTLKNGEGAAIVITPACEFVDLGLPSGTLWADRNVGAESETDFGYYLAWGEKFVHYTSANPATGAFIWKTGFENGYCKSTYSMWDNSTSKYTKYNATDGLTQLQKEDDICCELYGNSCSVPSLQQCQELVNYCTKTRTGNGYEFTGTNGNKIFIPVNGAIQTVTLYNYDNFGGYYWTKDLKTTGDGYSFHYGGQYDFYYSEYERSYGFGIRAVKRGPVLMSWVDLGLESGTLWSETNLNASSATEYGLYYQFGSTTGHDNSEAASYSTWSTAPFNGGSSTFDATSWNAHKASAIDSDGNLKQEYDAAYQQTYGLARTPTQAQIEELCALENEWTNNYNSTGVHGRIFHGNNGETLFIPAAGCYYDGNANYVGQNGVLVWSRTVNGDENARYMYSWDTAAGSGLDAKPRYYSYPIRPVKASGE